MQKCKSFGINKQKVSLFFQRVKIPYARGKPEALASDKVVGCEARTEGGEVKNVRWTFETIARDVVRNGKGLN